MTDDIETIRVDLTYNHRDSEGHEDALEALDRIAKQLKRLEEDLAAEKFARREYEDRAREMQVERDRLLEGTDG